VAHILGCVVFDVHDVAGASSGRRLLDVAVNGSVTVSFQVTVVPGFQDVVAQELLNLTAALAAAFTFGTVNVSTAPPGVSHVAFAPFFAAPPSPTTQGGLAVMWIIIIVVCASVLVAAAALVGYTLVHERRDAARQRLQPPPEPMASTGAHRSQRRGGSAMAACGSGHSMRALRDRDLTL
jgi:hypothetical protein